MAPVRPSWHSAASLKRRPGGGNGVSATEVAVAPPKTVVDLLETDDAKALLEAGREHGQLSADEIAVALDELDLEPAQLDDFYHALEELHIEVVAGREEDEQEAVEEPREVSTDALRRSSTTAKASSSPPTRPGGSVRRSHARSPTRRARSGCRSTSSRS